MSEPAKNEKKARRSSAHRTEQNRLAQRRYRARQKAKWEALQASCSSAAHSDEAEKSLTRQLPPAAHSSTDAADASSSYSPWTRTQSPPLPVASNPHLRQQRNRILLNTPSAGPSTCPSEAFSIQTGFDDLQLLDIDSDEWDLDGPLDLSQPDETLDFADPVPFQSTDLTVTNQPSTQPGKARIAQQRSKPPTSARCIDDIVAAFQEHSPYHASPRLNHLRMVPLSNVAAAMANAHQICPAPNPHRSTIKSPFFEASAQAQPHLALSGVHFFSFLSPDMRPTQKQISIPHPVWIDTIPIPVFRDAVLSHWSVFEAEPDSRLLKELNEDIINGAFVCWGSERSKNGMGVPWEARSWEMRSCFLRKWGWLFKGIQGSGELIRTSRWWAHMRGEQFDDAFATSLQLE